MRKHNAGIGVFMVVVLLFAVAATALIVNSLTKVSTSTYRNTLTNTNAVRIRDALAAFVTTNGHLPCPANGSLDAGIANPSIANPICGSPNGTVPWDTLGIAQETSLDGWGRKFSYRVFSGNTGLTQPNGASMVNCDSQKPGGAVQLSASGLCAVDHSNLSSQFLNNKGLIVNISGTNETRIAFVLVSHGETGYGAWLPAGNRMTMPDGGNTSEFSNAGSGGTYYTKEFSVSTVQPGDTTHFDDVLFWVGIEDLAKRSGLVARDWPEDEPEFTAQTTTDMTTTSTNRFNVTTASGGQTVTTTTTVDDAGRSVVTLNFAAGGAGAYYTNCLWWPQSLITYNGVDKFALHAYLEFSTADGSRSGNAYNDLGGMVVGFLPWNSGTGFTSIATDLCGRSDVSTYLGWENNSGLGNLPAPRFGVEYDAYQHAFLGDPLPGHLSLVYSGVTHGTSASTCSGTADNYFGTTCYTGPANSWLRDGLNYYHKIRVLVLPQEASCSNAPKFSVWLFPYSVCSDAANASICTAMTQLSTDFAPATLPTGAVQLDGCIASPTPADAFDRLYFGLTLANRVSAGIGGTGMFVRNLSINGRLVP